MNKKQGFSALVDFARVDIAVTAVVGYFETNYISSQLVEIVDRIHEIYAPMKLREYIMAVENYFQCSKYTAEFIGRAVWNYANNIKIKN